MSKFIQALQNRLNDFYDGISVSGDEGHSIILCFANQIFDKSSEVYYEIKENAPQLYIIYIERMNTSQILERIDNAIDDTLSKGCVTTSIDEIITKEPYTVSNLWKGLV